MLHEAVNASFQVARIAGGVPEEPGELHRLSERLADYWEYLCNFGAERRARPTWELLKSNRALLPGAVEECVRHRTVTKRMFRITNIEVELGGVTVPEGALVALSLASANHDEAVYENPERFDIRRAHRNLTFGRGKHFCLGAPLAKTEMRITLETLLDLAPDAVIVDDQPLEWKPDYRLEALTGLRVNLKAGTNGASG